MNRQRVGTAAVLALAVAGGASAQGEPSLEIHGTSTVRSWTCEAESFRVEPIPATGFEDGVLRGEPALETVTLRFPVAAIECGNAKMNDHLRNALQLEDHPLIAYRLSGYDISAGEAGVAVEADGELEIAGTTRPVVTTVTVTRDATGAVWVQGEQEVDMTDFGVVPPTLMFGALKVGDRVTVKFDVPLRATTVGAVAARDRK